MFTVITAREQRTSVISSETSPHLVSCLNASILEIKSRLGFYLIHRSSVCCSMYHILSMLLQNMRISLSHNKIFWWTFDERPDSVSWHYQNSDLNEMVFSLAQMKQHCHPYSNVKSVFYRTKILLGISFL